MEKKYRISRCIVNCVGFILLNIHFTNGIVTLTNSGTPYIGQSFTMTCTITSFSGTATLTQDGTLHTTCGTSFCSPSTKGNYTFSHSASTLSVKIDPISSSDQGTWLCTHSSGSSSYDLNPQMSLSSADKACWCVFDCDDGIGCYVLIACSIVIIILLVIIVLLIIYCCGWCCFKKGMTKCCIRCCTKLFCQKYMVKDPELNNIDKLHYLCCTRGGTFSEQNFTCLLSAGRVSDDTSMDYNPLQNTGRNINAEPPLPPIGEKPLESINEANNTKNQT